MYLCRFQVVLWRLVCFPSSRSRSADEEEEEEKFGEGVSEVGNFCW